jgi:mannose-1-phosphate guanylyltransferase/mannose-6-phosphate isomerase
MLSSLKCNSNVLIKDVLVKLNENRRKFVICVDEFDCVVGVVTDGDIRRALLNNISIIDTIDKIYNASFKYLNIESPFSEVCELFRLSKIDFLPIIDKDRVLLNVLTKVQFHLALLENIDFDLMYDFFQLDGMTLEHEIYNRPWGFYKSTFLTTHAQAKIITVLPNSELSLQKHFKREEHWVILRGEGKVVLGEVVIDAYPGKYIYIPKECKHQIINNTDENLIFSEVQLGEYFGEDDIIRFADKYGRDLKGENDEI